MKKSKTVLIALILTLVVTILCTIRIAYADSQNKTDASSNSFGLMQQNFDTKKVEQNSKTSLTSYDKSGPKGEDFGDISGLSNSLATNTTSGTNSQGDYSKIVGGSETTIPKGLGKKHSYTSWQSVNSSNADAFSLVRKTGLQFDNEGFARVRGRYVIICTKVFGAVGDYVDFYKENGTVIPCIIGDLKGGSNKWGTSGGKDIVDFFVDRNTWYPVDEGGNASKKHVNPGTKSFHSEWSDTLAKSVNGGSYFINTSGTKTVQDTTVVDPSTDEISNKTSSEYVHQMISLLNSYSPTFNKYGNKIGYSNGYVPQTYSAFLKSLKKGNRVGANCATCINYALEDMGLISRCNVYYRHGQGFQNVTTKLSRVTKRISKANGLSVKQASKQGLLKYGDIVGLKLSNGSQHTFVYAGLDKKGRILNYESGGSARKSAAPHFPYGCGPFKFTYGESHKIGSILRFVD